MELSLTGWLGALAGTVVGVAVYAVMLPWVRSRFGRPGKPQSLEDRDALERQFSVVRRTALAAAILGCAAIGYWLGKALGG